MELNSPINTQDSRGHILEAQIRECYGRVVYSHKTHEKCADILLSRSANIKVWQIILSAITSAGFIAAIFGKGQIAGVIGIIISTTLIALNTYTKDYDLGELAQKHKQAAAELWLIREEYLSLLTTLKMGSELLEQIIEKRDKLLQQLHSVYLGAPSTTFKAYREAQRALKDSEELTFSDQEIDSFLPKELKKTT